MSQSMAQAPPRARRVKRVRYTYESESDHGFSDPRPRSDRPLRNSSRIPTYRENSESNNDSDSSSSILLPTDTALPRPSTATHLRTSRAASRKGKRKLPIRDRRQTRSFALFKRQKNDTKSAKHESGQSKPEIFAAVPPSGKIPPWQQLPYHVLQNIMRYATYPLYEETSRSTPSISWLCSISQLCRSFHEACIATLLYSPPLYPAFRAHGLLCLLRRDQTTLMTNYQVKIKCLDVEVKNLLIRKSGIQLDDLIDCTPLLDHLRLYHNHDYLQHKYIWAQPGESKGGRWSYPDHLFDKLDDNKILLKSFEWNGRFPSVPIVLDMLISTHRRSCFSRLREVAFLNFNLAEKTAEEELQNASNVLASSLQDKTELRSLIFRNSNIINEHLLNHLPSGLQSLEIANCLSLSSPLLEGYLSERGGSLLSLRLVGNQVMSLGFAANLQTTCPQLQHLYIDLTYTDPTSYRDRDPLFDELLPDGPPTWPTSLRYIEIENLRQLSAQEAEHFFQSLVDVSEQLIHLRSLKIKAILKDASWRDRAEMRKKWMPTLHQVFMSDIALSQDVAGGNDSNEANMDEETSSTSTTKPPGRRSARNRQIKKAPAIKPTDNPSQVNSLPRHGRCDVVQLMISDQRPAQDQYHENDFLDDEPSDDEEWTGQDGRYEGGGYAW